MRVGPEAKDVFGAARRIESYIRRTPLERCFVLEEEVGCGPVYLKLENQQRTRSFKLRGALNRVLALSKEERRRGIVTASSGNHGQGVAMAAALAGVKATVVVPEVTPAVKIREARRFGAEVIRWGADFDAAEEKAWSLVRELGGTFVHPCIDPEVMAGQGTVGLEVLNELPDVATLVVPVGGGGLIGGIGVLVKAVRPDVRIVGVQAEASPALYESLRAGRLVRCPVGETLAEGLAGNAYEKTFPLLCKVVDEMVLVSEAEIARAMAWLVLKAGQVVEGSGAVGVAALLFGKVSLAAGPTVCVLSGGNVDAATLRRVVAEEGAAVAAE